MSEHKSLSLVQRDQQEAYHTDEVRADCATVEDDLAEQAGSIFYVGGENPAGNGPDARKPDRSVRPPVYEKR